MKSTLFGCALAAMVFGSARADETKPAKSPLPRERTVQWDVRTFESAACFTVVSRTVKDNQVTWVLENRRALGTEISLGYQAEFLDEDGIKFLTVGIATEPFLMNLGQGERNRFTLVLPRDEQWKAARKVVIRNPILH